MLVCVCYRNKQRNLMSMWRKEECNYIFKGASLNLTEALPECTDKVNVRSIPQCGDETRRNRFREALTIHN